MPTTITQEQAAAAFTAWETAYREDPSKYLTADEVRAMEAAESGTACAIYFMALLRNTSNQPLDQ